ncbi:MAG: ChbG/HpnK family deacetylase [Cytophagales bacterium]|nr:ChbG/HpnK family deacetylase [Cytophaga sp.]
MQRQLILNADDFGWDKDASTGILKLVDAGKICNVSVMANHVEEEDLLRLRQYHSSISTGLHITLNAGYPLSYKRKNSLIDDHTGKFHTSQELFHKALRQKINYTDVLDELKAQRKRLLDSGIRITHADSHQHIHQYPVLGRLILQALKDLGIKKVRNCAPLNIYDERRMILSAFCLLTRRKLNMFQHPDVLITDFTNKHFDFSSQPVSLFDIIAKSKYQVVEWMCHPALQNREDSYLQRKQEFDFLKTFDWNALLSTHNFKMEQYKNL